MTSLTRAAVAAVSLLAVPAVAMGGNFKSPSGNIQCLVTGGSFASASCLVRNATWPSPPKKPASCQLDWDPYQMTIYRKHVFAGACRGDIGPACQPGVACPVLRYGHGVTVGDIRCTSARTGITCRLRKGRGIGFRIAREGYAVLH
ncbi:MAG: DUF6636 domain-containing protein [Thermoleophilia bacterium]